MNPFKRLLDFVRNPSNTRTVGILAVLVIALAIPLTVNIAQKQQEIRQHAASISEEQGTGGSQCDPSLPCSGWSYTDCTLNDGENLVPGHKASCGGVQDQVCYPGAAPDLSSCPKPISSAPNPALTQPAPSQNCILGILFCSGQSSSGECMSGNPSNCVCRLPGSPSAEGCTLLNPDQPCGYNPSFRPYTCTTPQPPTSTEGTNCTTQEKNIIAGDPVPSGCTNIGFVNGDPSVQRYSCQTCTTSQPANQKPLCSGECTGVQTCQQINDGTIDTNQRCDTPGTACCMPKTSSGTASGLPSCNTIAGGECILNAEVNSMIGGPNQDASALGSCPSGQTCYKCIPTTSTNCSACDATGHQTCRTDCNIGQYINQVLTCTPPAGGAPGGTTTATCNTSLPGHWEYMCGIVTGCTATQHKATYICDNKATPFADPICYDGTTIPVPTGSQLTGSTNYGNCTQTTSGTAPTASAPANSISCPSGLVQCTSPFIPKGLGNNLWTCINSSGSTATPTSCNGAPAAPAPGGTCKTDSASASSCAFACNIVNGVNMKCNIQNKDANGVCSGVCTGQWNCAVDSACLNPNGTILSFVIGLDGIGTTGDVKNPNLNNTRSPNHSIRNLATKLINTSGTVTSTNNGNISYSSGKFTANVNLGSVTPGTYTVKIKSDGYLSRLISAPLTITAGTVTYTLSGSPVSLVTGDINGNNQLDINDYQILLSCSTFSNDNHAACNSNSSYPALSDLDDNGVVNQLDYNLFVREISLIQNGD